ncbi:hypothetical protein HY745_05705 [Candidatus Desantisbacteria bacterium]|nr:hypothetical protein [Candidatus Desantisbacteria bacterium]
MNLKKLLHGNEEYLINTIKETVSLVPFSGVLAIYDTQYRPVIYYGKFLKFIK